MTRCCRCWDIGSLRCYSSHGFSISLIYYPLCLIFQKIPIIYLKMISNIVSLHMIIHFKYIDHKNSDMFNHLTYVTYVILSNWTLSHTLNHSEMLNTKLFCQLRITHKSSEIQENILVRSNEYLDFSFRNSSSFKKLRKEYQVSTFL